MPIRLTLLVAALWSMSSPAFALIAAVPEIDGALSIQAIALMGGLVYLLKRKK